MRQLAGEIRKLFARKRTFIGFGAFLAFEILVFCLLRFQGAEHIRGAIGKAGYDPAFYFSGLTLGFLIVMWTVLLLEALFLALVAGDVVSKEVEDGSMRMMLCRPVSRGRILVLKAIVCCLYTFVLTFFVMLTALGAGLINSGFGGLFAVSQLESVFAFYDFWPGLGRYFLAMPLLSLSLCTIAMLAFCFSCCNMKPSAATVLTLSILFADFILEKIPYFESIHHWFLSPKLGMWVHLFEYRIPWEAMVESYSWLIAINFTLFFIGWAIFESRDFKS